MTEEVTAVPSYPRVIKRRIKWRKTMLSVAIIAIVFCAILLVVLPMLTRTRGPHLGKNEITNVRQIGFALLEFDSDYGAYPSAATAALITENYPAHGYDLTGNSSNAAFRQFFATGLTESEMTFHASIRGAKRPDGIISPGNLLAPGECGFSYISGLTSAGDPSRPIILTPLIPGTTKFDPKPFGGNAIFLRGDNSVSSNIIGKDGHVRIGGIDILSPENPIWDGKAPDIRYPE